MSKETWEDRFDKEFLERDYCGDRECMYDGKDKCFHSSENKIKQFIKTELENQKKEIVKQEWQRHIEFLQTQYDGAKLSGETVYYQEMKNALDNSLNWYKNIFGKLPTTSKKHLKITICQKNNL